MKLKNFMYATMIACAFASCSKDDAEIVGPDGPDAKGDANLTIVVDSKNLATKAVRPDGNTNLTLPNEADIKSLTLVVFNSSGDYLGHSTNPSGTDGKVSILGLQPQAIKFAVFANMPDIADGTIKTLTSATLLNQVITLPANGFSASAEGVGLPMSSAVVDGVTLVSGNNYYGYSDNEMTTPATNGVFSKDAPLKLVRNVARIDLEDVKLDMKNSDYVSGTATFEFTGVSIQHAANKAIVKGVAPAGTAGLAYVTGGVDAAYYVETPAQTLTQTTQSDFTTDAVAVTHTKAYFYVLANVQKGADADKATDLVIKGKFSLTGAKKTGSEQTYNLAVAEGYYPITIGTTGVADAAQFDIENNKVYKISLNVAGPGKATTTGEEKANFFVKCTVAEWETVNQSGTIK